MRGRPARRRVRAAGERALPVLAVAALLGGCGARGRGDDQTPLVTGSRALELEQPIWEKRMPAPPGPGGRYGPAMAYDSARGKVVLFGGTNNGVNPRDTWEWDGAAGTWTDRTPKDSASPSARYFHAMVFDSHRARVVLFGGVDNGVGGQDTWEWDGAAGRWVDRTPAGDKPAARLAHGMAFDSVRNKVVMAGGAYGSTAFFDTWEWDGDAGAWMQRRAEGAPGGNFITLVFDSGRSRTVGGTPGSLREWDADAGVWNQRPTGSPPPGRNIAPLIYDSSRRRIILFGGDRADMQDTWELDTDHGTWTERMPQGALPAAHYGHALAFDDRRGTALLFGGIVAPDDITLYDDTWEYHVTHLVTGSPCAQADRCASLACIDGACCSSDCQGSCRACNVPGFEGDCHDIAAGNPEPGSCDGASACDGNGGCKKANGQPCTSPDVCGSGHCADGVCCSSGCAETCKACNLPGSLGTCTYLSMGASDDAADLPCAAPHSCDGRGVCLATRGEPCTDGAHCASGFCVDGVCCVSSSCAGICRSCAVPNARGDCADVPAGEPDPDTCGSRVCAGGGRCGTATGQGCRLGDECASGFCVDGVCCATSRCPSCSRCDVEGSAGNCHPLPSGASDAKGGCASPRACDGRGVCKQGLGQPCAADGDCLNEACADGICCASACTQACWTCATAVCRPSPPGAADDFPRGACTAPWFCNGKGMCVLPSSPPDAAADAPELPSLGDAAADAPVMVALPPDGGRADAAGADGAAAATATADAARDVASAAGEDAGPAPATPRPGLYEGASCSLAPSPPSGAPGWVLLLLGWLSVALARRTRRWLPGHARRKGACALLVLALLVPRAGRAQPASADDDERARVLFLVGKYQEALEIYARLYVETDHPTYLRNIGRCHQMMGDPDRALNSFHDYLRKAGDISAEARNEVEEFIAEMEQLKRTRQPRPATRASVPAPLPARDTRPVPTPASVSTPAPAAVAAAERPASAEAATTHAGQWGALLRLDSARVGTPVLVPGATYGVAAGIDLAAAALVGRYRGGWLGGRALLGSHWKPGITLGAPLFVVDGALLPGLQGGPTLQWDPNRHLGVFLDVTVSFFPGVASDLGSVWLVPALGVQGRL